ncbi:MAG TPA: HAMP domain-containing protein [Herpetosiphonaceae bacterium]
MNLLPTRLAGKVVWTSFAFLLIVALVTGLLVKTGFDQTEETATARSLQGFIDESRQTLAIITAEEAQLTTSQLQTAATLLTTAGDQLLASAGATASPTATQLTRNAGGTTFDPNPNRVSDIWIPSTLTVNAALRQRIAASASLDTLAPSLLRQYPDAASMAFTAVDGWARYYPPVGLQDLVPSDFPVTNESFFVQAIPPRNTTRATAWTPPYVDPAGQGLLTTVSLPVYDGDDLLGVLNMDVSLTKIIERLAQIKTTPGSAAFLLSADRRLVAGAPAALAFLTGDVNQTASVTGALGLDLSQSANGASILQVITPGQAGTGQVKLSQGDMFVTSAPLPNVGWNLAIITPSAEVTEQAAEVSSAIQQGTTSTLRTTLLALAGLFLVALVAVAFVSRRFTAPLLDLVGAARRVAAGDLDQNVAVTRQDEIGDLQGAFSRMVTNLAEQQASLGERTRALEQSLETQKQLVGTIQQLSVPLLPVLDDVLVLPLVGHIDEQRANDLTDSLLQGVYEQRARMVIIDITGVAAVDGKVLELLLKAARAVQLLGTRVTLAGISPEIAQYIAQQQVDLTGIETRQNAQMAIQHALRTMGASQQNSRANS